MIAAVVLLAGKGKRFKSKTSKNLTLLNKKPLFSFVPNVCLKNKNINKTILVVNKKEKSTIEKYFSQEIKNSKLVVICGSNKTRQESLSIGVQCLSNILKQNDVVVTLDGDRIFVTNDLINKSIIVAKKYKYANTIISLNDSIIKFYDKAVYLNRNNICLVQTPQTFLYNVWNLKQSKGTDLFSSLNLRLEKDNLIKGNPLNFKITVKEDLELASKLV